MIPKDQVYFELVKILPPELSFWTLLASPEERFLKRGHHVVHCILLQKIQITSVGHLLNFRYSSSCLLEHNSI